MVFLLVRSLSILQVPLKSVYFMMPSLTLTFASLFRTSVLLLCVYFYDGAFLLPYVVIPVVCVLPPLPIKLEIPYGQKLALFLVFSCHLLGSVS